MKCKNWRALTTKIKSFDTFFIIATTSSSLSLSLLKIGLIVLPISTGISIGNKLNYDVIMYKKIKYKKQNQKDQQTIKSFEKLEKVFTIQCN